MGNSNIEPRSPAKLQPLQLSHYRASQPSPSQHPTSILEISYYDTIYGQYALKENDETVITKTYQIASAEEKYQLESLIASCQQIHHPSFLKIQAVYPSQGSQKNTYKIQFQKNSVSLAESIAKRNKKYEEVQLLKMVLQIVEVLMEFSKFNLPMGLLNSAKIAVKREQTCDLLVPLEVLMHPETYRTAGAEAITEKGVVFSLGMLLLNMAYLQECPNENIKSSIFQLRNNYSFELSHLFEKMAQVNLNDRLTLAESFQQIKSLLLDHQKGRIRTGNCVIKRGYNCLESLFFLEQSAISSQVVVKVQNKPPV